MKKILKFATSMEIPKELPIEVAETDHPNHPDHRAGYRFPYEMDGQQRSVKVTVSTSRRAVWEKNLLVQRTLSPFELIKILFKYGIQEKLHQVVWGPIDNKISLTDDGPEFIQKIDLEKLENPEGIILEYETGR